MNLRDSVLFVIDSDPRINSRPAEAIRMAAGIAAWKKVRVELYLRGPALLLLGDQAEELVDGDLLGQFFPIIREGGKPVWVQLDSTMLTQLDHAPVRYEAITDQALAVRASQVAYTMRF
jgi:hypothetical protein